LSKLPVVAIVGRANVGKSSLFNAVLGRRQAVVAREAGTTRDAIRTRVDDDGKSFVLVDTAGLKAAEDEFEASIQEQITEASEAADAILVVVDATAMVTDEDRRVAKMAHKSKKPVILVLNKIDAAKNNDLDEWKKLGIKEVVTTSAAQRRGIRQLLSNIAKVIPKKRTPKGTKHLSIALLGRPNVGKSKLFNTMAKKQQAIVADLAGTTRDVNRIDITYHKNQVTLLDTAGIRRSGKIEVGIERFSVLRSVSAIEESDVCLLLMDPTEIGAKLDQKIAGMIADAGKGLILIVSKWDSVDKDAYTHDQLAAKVKTEFQFVPWAQLVFTSAVTGQNVAKIFDLAMDIGQKRQVNLKTSDLNRVLGDAVAKHPPAGLKNTHPKLKYMTQTGTAPPTFTVFGKHLSTLHWSYKRYLERNIRENAEFDGTPIWIKYQES